MNSALIPLDSFLKGLGLSTQTYADLSKDSSGVSLVTSTLNEAYCFDELVRRLFNVLPHSTDAILLKNNVYFIEFKRIANVTNRKQKEIIKQDIKLKLSESALIFHKKMVEPLSLNSSAYKRVAVIVFDHNTFPVSAISGALSSLSGGVVASGNSASPYQYFFVPDRSGNCIFYDDVIVLNGVNFNYQIASLL